jgi:hypothetical protein
MKLRSIFFAGLLAVMSALAIGTALTPAPAEAATCALYDGKWKCGGATLKAAKSACNVTTGNFEHSCDSGINVCTCATRSSKRPGTNITNLSGGDSDGTTLKTTR